MDCLITNGKQYIRLDSNGSPQTCGQVLAERFSCTANNSYNSVPAVKDEETGELMTINQLKEKLNEDN